MEITNNMTITLTIIGLILAAIAAYYAFKQYDHQSKQKEKDIIVNVKPEIKIEPGIKISETKVEKAEPKTIPMDDDYYTKLGVDILRSKKGGDDFNIYETK